MSQQHSIVLKVEDKDVKKRLMDMLLEFKEQVAKVMQVMSSDSYGHLGNMLIA